MILVRSEFQCKEGSVNEMVDRFKAMSQRMDDQEVIKRSRIMTDLSGSFDTVVVESEVESIDDYFALLQAEFARQGSQALNGGLYQTGKRTFYTIEATYGQEA